LSPQLTAGSVERLNREFIVRTGGFLEDADDVAGLVIGVSGSHPVYLRDVAEIIDGPEDVNNYVFFGQGPAGKERAVDKDQEFPAVTLAVAKRKGADAMRVADQVMEKIEAIRPNLLPSDIYLTETRNYGETASEKVLTLLEHLLGAVIAVTIVVGIFLGWRGGLVVFASVPVTFALTLFVYYLFGYTLNRVTLFALIFVTGIVVDDSIIVAENVHRHFLMRRRSPLKSAIAAISEVGNPTILATFTVIASVLPMAFVSGLMGPYMSPMPIGASMAMLFSLFVALVGTPWLAYRLLKSHEGDEKEYRVEDTFVYRFYNKTLAPLLDNSKRAWISIAVVCGLLLLSTSLFIFRLVEVKILPFDNKSEMQVIIDMPEGTTLEQTARVAKEISGYLKTVPEVTHYQYYVGTNAPINFNGLVRHYYLRRGPTVSDIQVNLVHKGDRSDQSHDIAKRLRPRIQEIAGKYEARVKVAEVPPGPPVLSTLVAEIYGPDYKQQIELARKVREIFETTDGVVDVDWLVEDDQPVFTLVVDKEKAAIRGVSSEQIAQSLRMAISGGDVALLRTPTEIEPVVIQLRLARESRTSVDDLGGIYVRSNSGQMIPIVDVVQVMETVEDKAIYRKNLQRVVYVTGDVAGAVESPVYAILDMDKKLAELELPNGHKIKPLYTKQPFLEEELSMKWDGEWQITYEVFRDLGGAFAIVLVIIYLLTIGWFQSFRTPLVMMIAIPLSLVGIIPGHWVHGAFFTATSMIGMIALAGIMVRNSVLIIDFIQLRRDDGAELRQAVVEAAGDLVVRLPLGLRPGGPGQRLAGQQQAVGGGPQPSVRMDHEQRRDNVAEGQRLRIHHFRRVGKGVDAEIDTDDAGDFFRRQQRAAGQVTVDQFDDVRRQQHRVIRQLLPQLAVQRHGVVVGLGNHRLRQPVDFLAGLGVGLGRAADGALFKEAVKGGLRVVVDKSRVADHHHGVGLRATAVDRRQAFIVLVRGFFDAAGRAGTASQQQAGRQ